MKKIIELESSNEFNSEDMIVQSAHSLYDLYQNAAKISRIRIDAEYLPKKFEPVSESFDDLYKSLQDDPINESHFKSEIMSTDTMIKSLMILILNYYHDKDWMDKYTFYEFARKFTNMYEILSGKNMDGYILDYDEIGNCLTTIGLGYNVIGGFQLRKLSGSDSEKPYKIDKITD